jgi:hypothetical protein
MAGAIHRRHNEGALVMAKGTFTVTGGSEQTIREAPGEVKLTRVSGTQRFGGGIVGDGSVEATGGPVVAYELEYEFE